MSVENEAIRLAVDLMEQCYAVANTKDFANRYTAQDAMNDLSAAKTLASQAIKTLRPHLDQTSAGVGDGGYGIIDAIEWADGVAGALGSEYASRVTDEEIAVAMAIKSALTQADQPADKDDRRALLDEIDITLDYFRDEFSGEKDVWDDPISAYAGGISANDLLKIKRALSGSDGRE